MSNVGSVSNPSTKTNETAFYDLTSVSHNYRRENILVALKSWLKLKCIFVPSICVLVNLVLYSFSILLTIFLYSNVIFVIAIGTPNQYFILPTTKLTRSSLIHSEEPRESASLHIFVV